MVGAGMKISGHAVKKCVGVCVCVVHVWVHIVCMYMCVAIKHGCSGYDQ